MGADPLRLYLSSSIANGPLNARLREHLPSPRFELVLPQEFSPVELAHPSFPRAIYERCIEEMEGCDAALLLLDAFGVDCASEAGWLCARNKPLIGIAAANLRFLQHWMVKGNLSSVICLDAHILEAVRADPILSNIPVRYCLSWESLDAHVEALVPSSSTSRGQGV